MANNRKKAKSRTAEPMSARFPNVTCIETWKNRLGNIAVATGTVDAQGIRMLTRREKQAVLLVFVLSDDVEESRLDAVFETAFSPASH